MSAFSYHTNIEIKSISLLDTIIQLEQIINELYTAPDKKDLERKQQDADAQSFLEIKYQKKPKS